MEIASTALPEVKLIRLDVFGDERGAFAETYDREKFAALGVATTFVQDSWSVSKPRGTIRGLHYQLPPRAQEKLVRVIRGRAFDVVVDIRRSSPRFGRHVALELSGDDPTVLWVPVGFAHGFCTLEPDTEITYKMSDHFVPSLYRGLNWSDPDLGIRWPVGEADAVISPKDRAHPGLRDLGDVFPMREA